MALDVGATSVLDNTDTLWASFQRPLEAVALKSLDARIPADGVMQAHMNVYHFAMRHRDPSTFISRVKNSELYKLYERIETFLTTYIASFYTDAAAISDAALLQWYLERWEIFQRAVQFLELMFRQLNLHWTKQVIAFKVELQYTEHLCFLLWRTHVVYPLHERLTSAMLADVRRYRDSELPDLPRVKAYGQMLSSPGVPDLLTTGASLYDTLFLQPYLADLHTYYTVAAAACLHSTSLVQYATTATAWLARERDQTVKYLHSSSLDAVVAAADACLIAPFAQAFAAEFPCLLEAQRFDDAGTIHALLARLSDGLSELYAAYEQCVCARGHDALSLAGPDPAEGVYIQTLLNVHRTYHGIVTGPLHNDPGFMKAFDKAYTSVVNSNAVVGSNKNKTPELLVRFCDGFLVKGNRSTDDVTDLSKDVLTVFKYLENKDVFEQYYAKFFSRRLIQQTSVSEEAEEWILNRLKESCGHSYTLKLTRMFGDMTTSRDLNTAFTAMPLCTPDRIPLNVHVLSTGVWPVHTSPVDFHLPGALEPGLSAFTAYYNSKFLGRKLTWLHGMGKAEVRATFAPGKTPYTFQVSLYQVAVLLQFNDATDRTLQELAESTQLAPDVLAQLLAVFVKARVVTTAAAEPYEPSSRFTVNTAYKNKKLRMNLNVPLKVEQKAEAEVTSRQIVEDRRMLIQAAVVRIMKMRKTHTHAALVSDVIEQLQGRFRPSIPDIKRGIALLIEKEYIERDPNAHDVFLYIA